MEKLIVSIMFMSIVALTGYTMHMLSGTHAAVSKTVSMFIHN